MPITPAVFVRRLYAQLEKGKGMRFSAEEMDMLAEMGAIDAVSKFAADWVRQQSEGRLTAVRTEVAGANEQPSRAPRSRYKLDLSAEESMRRARNKTRSSGKRH